MLKLFDFDLEVKPMLEVLVGKTIEQALLEVMAEEELANLRAGQCAYEEIRNVELAEVQRLEEQERRHREEKVQRPGVLLDTLCSKLHTGCPKTKELWEIPVLLATRASSVSWTQLHRLPSYPR